MSRVSLGAMAVAATLAGGSTAFAASLHFVCAGGTTCATSANIITTNQTPTFGIQDDGAANGGSTGNLYIDFLVPTSVVGFSATLSGVSPTPSGGPTTPVVPTGANTQPWNGAPQLGPWQFAGGPNGNPASALGGGGPFNVFDIVFTGITLFKANVTPPEWTSSTLPFGTVLVAFFDTPSGAVGTCAANCVKTANSEALFINSTTVVPLPGAVALFATGLVGLGLLGRRRKKIA